MPALKEQRQSVGRQTQALPAFCYHNLEIALAVVFVGSAHWAGLLTNRKSTRHMCGNHGGRRSSAVS